MTTQIRCDSGGTTLHLRKGTKATHIWAELKAAGALRVTLIVAGIVVRQRLQASLDNLELIVSFVDLRAHVNRKGDTTLYPRPHCELDNTTLLLNGELLALRFRKNRLVIDGEDRLSQWVEVWPLLATHILDNRPRGSFVVK